MKRKRKETGAVYRFLQVEKQSEDSSMASTPQTLDLEFDAQVYRIVNTQFCSQIKLKM